MAFWIQILAKQFSNQARFYSKFKLKTISKNFSAQNGFLNRAIDHFGWLPAPKWLFEYRYWKNSPQIRLVFPVNSS